MKHISTIAFLSLALLVLLAGCKKEGGTVTLGAKIAQNIHNAKVYVDNVSPHWNAGDMVNINGAAYTIALVGGQGQVAGVTASDNGYRAIYPDDLVSDQASLAGESVHLILPALQEYAVDENGHQIVAIPMGAYTSGNRLQLTFRCLCSVVRVSVSNELNQPLPLDSISIVASNHNLSGDATATVEGQSTDHLTMDNTVSAHRVTLNIGGQAVVPARGTSFFDIVCPPFDNDNVTITSYVSNYQASIKKRSVALGSMSVTSVNLPVAQLTSIPPEGAIEKLFTVGENDNGNPIRVFFSRGNLQWTSTGTHDVMGGSTVPGTWRFAEHQYDMIGSANSNISSSYTGWIDLFGYGTSGYHDPSDEYNTNYYPYSTSTTGPANYYNYYGYGPSGNNHNIKGTNYDWGVYNAISNGGNQPGMWRTLTWDEWYYLLYQRGDAEYKYRRGRIQLSDNSYINGLILLPDDWELTDFVSGTSSSWESNTLTEAQWLTMEENGAIFLPAAGYRTGPYMTSNSVGTIGQYWSSTYYSTYYADMLKFESSQISADYYNGNSHTYFYYGNSVRLVYQAQ